MPFELLPLPEAMVPSLAILLSAMQGYRHFRLSFRVLNIGARQAFAIRVQGIVPIGHTDLHQADVSYRYRRSISNSNPIL